MTILVRQADESIERQMNAAIDHRGREAGGATRPPRRVGLALACLATSGIANAAPLAATWSLLPQPAAAHLAGSAVVKIAHGNVVAIRGSDREQLQPIRDRFIQLLANTRGLKLQPATSADTHPVITFDVDPHANIVGDDGYRIE